MESKKGNSSEKGKTENIEIINETVSSNELPPLERTLDTTESQELTSQQKGKNKPNMTKWPFDKATTIALLALLLSVAQFLLTTPSLIEWYFKPIITVQDGPDLPGTNRKIFLVENTGRSIAENIEISLTAYDGDRVTGELGAVVFPDESVHFRNYRVVIPYLLAEETTVITVHKTDPDHQNSEAIIGYGINADGSTSDHLFRVSPFPSVNNARLKNGEVKLLTETPTTKLTNSTP